jgi:site-specific DNA-cytosine methylase
MPRIGATLFSGGRGVECLLRDAIDFRYAVEYDPAIAAVGAQLGGHTITAKAEDVDYSTWGALNYLHVSPVCKEYSQAKSGGAEGESDMTSAAAVVRCLEAAQPRVFTLENVGAYQHGQAYRLICSWLNHNGYMWHAQMVNAADYGVPQTRRRLILRAVKDALLPPLPQPRPWVGWYAAIEDLIPTLPESAFAPWQLARLPEEITSTALVNNGGFNGGPLEQVSADRPAFSIVGSLHSKGAVPRAFIVSNAATEYSDGIRDAAEPMLSVTTQTGGRVRAWFINEDSKMGIVDADIPAPTQVSSARALRARALLVHSTDQRNMPTRDQDEPSFTVMAMSYANSHQPGGYSRAWLDTGRVVRMTPRALARFQSFPDWYELPSKAGLACTVIGNAVPPLLMAEIVRPLC